MAEDWKVYNIFASTPNARESIVEAIRSISETLTKNGDLEGFYYNLYFITDEKGHVKVPPHVRFGFYKLKDETMIRDKLGELEKNRIVVRVEPTTPDLSDADGIPIDRIKLTARKITELLKADFGQPLTEAQAYYLIHLSMNPLFGYVSERNVYLTLTAAMEKAIRENNILPKKQWLAFLDEYLRKMVSKQEA